MKTKFAFVIALLFSVLKLAAQIPEKAIPFIFDNHLYIQGFVMDTIPLSLCFDTGAYKLYVDKDYMDMSSFGKMPLRMGKVEFAGTGNSRAKTYKKINNTIPLNMGNVTYKLRKTPILNLREMGGRHMDAIIGCNAVFDKPLLLNYLDGYLLPLDSLTPSILEGYTKLPARFKPNGIEIECDLRIDSIQHVKGKFLIDTGCSGAISLTNAARKRLDLKGKRQAKYYISNVGVGGDGTGILFRAESFSLLGELNNVVVSAYCNKKGCLSSSSYLGLIGNDILCHYDWIIDAPHKSLYVRRNNNQENSYQRSSKEHMGYIDRTDITDGWIVKGIIEGGIAQQVGFEIGDIIISINGRAVKEISWEEKRKGLGLNGRTTYRVKKKNGDIVTYILNIDKEIL